LGSTTLQQTVAPFGTSVASHFIQFNWAQTFRQKKFSGGGSGKCGLLTVIKTTDAFRFVSRTAFQVILQKFIKLLRKLISTEQAKPQLYNYSGTGS